MTVEPRSWLFVPADSDRKIAKALDSQRAFEKLWVEAPKYRNVKVKPA